ncbi:hypothetical protein FRB95_001549 [Tulasnella sp. JGI-2019a]|nr:hypothetical protein FRB93_011007 [Tulasnella sp. JGI-2019a]KAG9032367.1 hypothetical protein FRB95_001549 [Tulasnella sp. JGI-2019a]
MYLAFLSSMPTSSSSVPGFPVHVSSGEVEVGACLAFPSALPENLPVVFPSGLSPWDRDVIPTCHPSRRFSFRRYRTHLFKSRRGSVPNLAVDDQCLHEGRHSTPAYSQGRYIIPDSLVWRAPSNPLRGSRSLAVYLRQLPELVGGVRPFMTGNQQRGIHHDPRWSPLAAHPALVWPKICSL